MQDLSGSQPSFADPHGIEQRTLTLSAGVADWIGELLREATQALETGPASPGQNDEGQDGGLEPAWW
uniref:hypothetical protein n=1 Tax=Kitasatospora sp. NBC_01519 TaxID=2903576 RepID=UPI002F90F196